MKIPYPEIDKADIRPGDRVLGEVVATDTGNILYTEFTAGTYGLFYQNYYLIDRPKPKFPEEPGTCIIAKKLGGVEYPEGVVLFRHRGQTSYGTDYANYQVRWKSPALKVRHQDMWTEKQIEDWVLAKVVPA